MYGATLVPQIKEKSKIPHLESHILASMLIAPMLQTSLHASNA